MDDQVVRDVVAMGKFFASIDGIGVKKGSVTPGRAGAASPSLRLAVATTQAGLEVRVAASPALGAPPVSLATPAPPVAQAPARAARDVAQVEAVLATLREDIGDCKRCRLCEGRTNIVFGQGNAGAELLFVGEAPGADEDASGLAFVGRAGQLLTDMIEKGMKMQRSDVFIANVIKCRPPGNRPPENDEISTCQPFLEAQIRAIKPRAIVAMGATAGKFMAKSGDPISKIRGRFASWDGIPVMPTYHPAYLLRNPSAKKEVWADLKLVMDVLGLRSE